MSKVTEMVKAEADQTEAETPDEATEAAEEEEAQTIPAAEPEQPQPTPEEQSAEAQAKAFDREMTRHEKALCKLMEVEPPLPRVQLEGAIGFFLPGAVEWKRHADYVRCTTCNGHGFILTDSVRDGEQTAVCPDPRCSGRGYWRRDVQPQPTQPQGVSTFTPVVAEGNGRQDEWERPTWMGNPEIRAQPVQ